MANFQLGLLIGCFLGAVCMFVGLGIIGLLIDAREEKRSAAVRQAAHAKMPESTGIPPPADYSHPDHFSAPACKDPPAEDDKGKMVICTLLIHIE